MSTAEKEMLTGLDQAAEIIAGLREQNAKLRDLLTDVLHGTRDQKLTDLEGPSLEPSLRNEIRNAVRPESAYLDPLDDIGTSVAPKI